MRLLRQPLLHFLLIGCALLLADALWQRYREMQVDAPGPDAIAQLQRDWRQAQGRRPTDAELAALIEAEIERRILVREALRRGWHRRDPVVIRRLLQDAEFLGIEGNPSGKIEAVLALGMEREDQVIQRRLEERMLASVHRRGRPPSRSELEAFRQSLAATAPEPRWQLCQLAYLDGDTQQRARHGLARLQQATPADALRNEGCNAVLGDPFLHDQTLPLLTATRLRSMFGDGFVAALPRAVAPQWLGPIASRYGHHLVRVQAFQASSADSTAELTRQWQSAQRWRLERRLRESLRRRYRVIEP